MCVLDLVAQRFDKLPQARGSRHSVLLEEIGENLNHIPGRKCFANHERNHPAVEVGCFKEDMFVGEEPRPVLLE